MLSLLLSLSLSLSLSCYTSSLNRSLQRKVPLSPLLFLIHIYLAAQSFSSLLASMHQWNWKWKVLVKVSVGVNSCLQVLSHEITIPFFTSHDHHIHQSWIVIDAWYSPLIHSISNSSPIHIQLLNSGINKIVILWSCHDWNGMRCNMCWDSDKKWSLVDEWNILKSNAIIKITPMLCTWHLLLCQR